MCMCVSERVCVTVWVNERREGVCECVSGSEFVCVCVFECLCVLE